MSKPPVGFPVEPGYSGRCGSSWKSNITVDGALPGDIRGRDVTHEIKRIVSAVGDNPTRDLEAADALRDKIETRIASIRVNLTQSSDDGSLAPEQVQSLNWLITHAEQHLDAVFAIHDAWLYREGGAFPLDRVDAMHGFTASEDPAACIKKAESGGGIGTLGSPFGRPVVGGTNMLGDVWYVTCPTKAELDARPVARKDIKGNFEFALQSVRCAEYWLWKAKLVHQADPGGPGLGLKPGKGTSSIPGLAPGAGGVSVPGLSPGGTGGGGAPGFYAPEEPSEPVPPNPEGLPGGEDPVGGELPFHDPSPVPPPPPSNKKALVLGGLAALGVFAYLKLK